MVLSNDTSPRKFGGIELTLCGEKSAIGRVRFENKSKNHAREFDTQFDDSYIVLYIE